jgi:hypothetical protein
MLAGLIRSGIDLDVDGYCCEHRTKGEVKAVSQGLINDVDHQDVVSYAKLALAQVDV